MSEKLKKVDRFFQQLGDISLYVFVIYLPFYELILHILESKTTLSTSSIFWLSHFYEPLLVLLLVYYLTKMIFTRNWGKLSKSEIFLRVFILLAIVLSLVHKDQLSRSFEGLRFLLLPYAIYLLARLTNYRKPKTLISIYLVIAILFSAIGVLEYFFLPPAYWAGYFGISDFGYGQNSLIATSQATALLVGPNQLASYLILAFFYLLHRFFSSKKTSYINILESCFLLLVILAISLTYSRSALIGLMVAVIWMFISFHREVGNKIAQIVLFLVVAVTAAITFAMYNGELLRDIIIHGSSLSQHLQATKDSLIKLTDSGALLLFFGQGVGSAGPTALKIGSGIISENYYLQVIFEVGLVGFILLIAFIVDVIKVLYRGSKTLFFAFLALLINALFLHIFSDNPAMSVTIYILIALVVNIEESKQSQIDSLSEE